MKKLLLIENRVAKKICLFVVLILLSGSVMAQYKCKLVKNQTDAFTGNKVKVTDYEDNYKDSYKTSFLRLTQDGNVFTLFLGMNFISESTNKYFTIREGQVLMFLLENNDTIMLNAQATIKGSVEHIAKKSKQNLNNDYPISESQIERLSKSPVKQFRVFVVRPDEKEYGIDFEKNNKLGYVLMQMIACVRSSQ